MATILLNGVAFDTSAPTEQNDKLTVSGGTDALDVNLLGGKDLIEVATQGENISSSKMDGGEGDDTITIQLNGKGDDFIKTSTISSNSTIRGAAGDDTITINDGNVVLEGLVNGNAGKDAISVVRASGATIQGGADADTITLGTVDSLDKAGSRADNSIKDTTIYGGAGKDTITVQKSAELSASSTGVLNGGNDDDTILIADGAKVDGYAVNGNKGDDEITATGKSYTNTTIFGGQGDDTLRVGGGVTVVGGKGADTFSIESAGGVTIQDFDELAKKPSGAVDAGRGPDDDCFCDDEIQIDGHKVFHTTYTYGVERIKYTSASNWTGDLKVKAVAVGANTGKTAKVTYTATKTETIKAKAVARLFITQSKTLNGNINASLAGKNPNTYLPAVSYPATGITDKGATFKPNGLKAFTKGTSAENNYNTRFGPFVAADGKTAVIGNGTGQAYAKAVGYWTARAANGQVKGQVRGLKLQTYDSFEKGDFSFLQLTKTAKVGVTTNQKLIFNDVTQATIKNHWASYNKTKNTDAKNLYDMNFGTANHKVMTTGKAYMILTDLADKAYKTVTLDATKAAATAKVTLDLDSTFEAWHKNLQKKGTVTTIAATAKGRNTAINTKGTGNWDRVKGGNFKVNNTKGVEITIAANATRIQTAGGNLLIGTGTGNNKNAKAWTKLYDLKSNGKTGINQERTLVAAGARLFTKVNTLTANKLYWSTVQQQGEATYTTTVRNTNKRTATATNAKYFPNVENAKALQLTRNFGSGNTNASQDDFITASGKLVMKIKVSESATKKATKAVNTKVSRTTIKGTVLPIDTCPDFPNVTVAWNRVPGRELIDYKVDGQAKQGDITGDFKQYLLWANRDNNLQSQVTKAAIAKVGTTKVVTETNCTAGSNCTFETHKIVNARSNTNYGINGETFAKLNFKATGGNTRASNGFFSAKAFTVAALEAAGFGDNVAGTKAKDAPFRVLFFDKEGTDNGLYVISGHADYNKGALTAIDTNPTSASAFGGKHTIVKVTGEKGAPIELSDINLV